MDFNPSASFTSLPSSKLFVQFLNFFGEVSSYYIPNSENLVHLRVKIINEGFPKLLINLPTALYYDVLVFPVNTTFDVLIEHLESESTSTETILLGFDVKLIV